MTVYVWNTKVQYDGKFTESRKSQHNMTIKCPHIISDLKKVRVLAFALNESNILFPFLTLYELYRFQL